MGVFNKRYMLESTILRKRANPCLESKPQIGGSIRDILGLPVKRLNTGTREKRSFSFCQFSPPSRPAMIQIFGEDAKSSADALTDLSKLNLVVPIPQKSFTSPERRYSQVESGMNLLPPD